MPVAVRDLQMEQDVRGIKIQKVGIRGLEVPIVIIEKVPGRSQRTIGVFNMYVEVSPNQRGTHMSRFVEIANKRKKLNLKMLQDEFLPYLKQKLKANKAHVEVEFTYFIRKQSPMSREFCQLPVKCKFTASDYHKPKLTVITPITTVCPCSLELTQDNSAHNQRGYVTIETISQEIVWIEDIVKIAETAGRFPVYPLLKRPDEKVAVQAAFKKPRFVEDVVREVAKQLKHIRVIEWYKVSCENVESIHNHQAFAEIEKED